MGSNLAVMAAKKETIIVTGGAGLIGSHLIPLALKKYRVVSLDNYFIGRRENHVAGAEYAEGHTKDIEKLLGNESPAIIFHLGEYSRVEQSFGDMEFVWQSNVEGTFRVFEYWRKRGSKLVYAGSSTKFSDGGLGRDQSPYAWMKASNTELVRNYSSWFNIPYATTYFYNAYGAQELSEGPYASVIGRFKEQFYKGEPLTVVAPGNQRRNFTYAGDIARGLLEVGEKGSGDDYGLGNPQSYTILELAKMFGDNIKMLPARKGNRMDSIVDTSKAEREFGWRAEHTVREYIESLKRTQK